MATDEGSVLLEIHWAVKPECHARSENHLELPERESVGDSRTDRVSERCSWGVPHERKLDAVDPTDINRTTLLVPTLDGVARLPSRVDKKGPSEVHRGSNDRTLEGGIHAFPVGPVIHLDVRPSPLRLDGFATVIDGRSLPVAAHILRARGQPKRITEPNRVVPRIRIQIDPARQPDGILRQEGPMTASLVGPPILAHSSPRKGTNARPCRTLTGRGSATQPAPPQPTSRCTYGGDGAGLT